MDTRSPSPRNAEELATAIADSGYEASIDWTKDVRDASRISLEGFMAQHEVVRQLGSRGTIHLAGAGVVGNSAAAADVAAVIASFQRLVTAVGSSLASGNTSLRGQIAATIAHRTRLRLIASPAPGSLVLDLSPEAPPAEEIAPKGEAPMFDEPVPLADQALTEVIGLLANAGEIGPDADTGPLLGRIEELGARTASSLRTFTLALAAGEFDTQVGWAVPRQPTLRASVDRALAAEIARLVESRNLDAESATIEGELRTVSDLSAWVLDSDDGERMTVDGSEIDATTVNQLHPHSRVRIVTEMTPIRHVGGAVRYAYVAKSLEILA